MLSGKELPTTAAWTKLNSVHKYKNIEHIHVHKIDKENTTNGRMWNVRYLIH